MMGIKERAFGPLPPVSLEDLVPPDHFYRHLERSLDLGFVRDLVRDAYSYVDRPSIDPVVFFKMQLVLFFEGLRSERQQNLKRLLSRWGWGAARGRAGPPGWCSRLQLRHPSQPGNWETRRPLPSSRCAALSLRPIFNTLGPYSAPLAGEHAKMAGRAVLGAPNAPQILADVIRPSRPQGLLPNSL